MRETALRYAWALFLALLGGTIVAVYNPVDHARAELRQGVATLEPALGKVVQAIDRRV